MKRAQSLDTSTAAAEEIAWAGVNCGLYEQPLKEEDKHPIHELARNKQRNSFA